MRGPSRTWTLGRARWDSALAEMAGRERRHGRWERDRIQLEIRELDERDLERFAAALEAEFAGEIRWLHVDGVLHRATLGISPASPPREPERRLEAVERLLGLAQRPFPSRRAHPGDAEPLARRTIDAFADVLGVAAGLIARHAWEAPPRRAYDAATALSLLQNSPRLRAELARRVGRGRAGEPDLAPLNAIAQGVGSGPIGPALDLALQALRIHATLAQRALFERERSRLAGGSGVRPPVARTPRPRPLPRGRLDRYGDDALAASLGGFVVGLADTHDLHAASSAIHDGLPKAGRYGEEGFLAGLAHALAKREVLALDAAALRVFGKVDTLVVDAGLLRAGTPQIGRVAPLDEAWAREGATLAHRLFRPDDPEGAHEAEGCRLAPSRDPGVLHLSVREGNGWRVVARVETRQAPAHHAGLLFASARAARLRVAIAGDDGHLAWRVDEHLAGDQDLAEEIRRMQRAGAVVALVARGPPEALASADVGIGVADDGEPPLAGHLWCVAGAEGAAFVLDAFHAARRVSAQSIVLAGAGATLGTLLSAAGLARTKPDTVILVVNAATAVALVNGLANALVLARRPLPPRPPRIPWHTLEATEALHQAASRVEGLPQAEAERRRGARPRRDTRAALAVRAVATELASPFTPVLLGAAGLSAVVGSPADAALVGAVLALNAGIGGAQRYASSLEAVRMEESERLAARVLRDGRERTIEAADLVVGDVVLLESGDVVPADARVLRAEALEADESSLTGESLPVRKGAAPSHAAEIAERSSMVFEGTSVASGTARALVVATGRDTESRREGGKPESASGVEARLRDLTAVTFPAAIAAGAVLVGLGLSRNEPVDKIVGQGVSLAIAAVPEGLPMLATIAQLHAAQRLARRDILVRDPRAIEGLGRVDVLCVDKTGTLTRGEIRVQSLSEGARDASPDDAGAAWARAILAAALRATPQPSADGRPLPHATDRAVAGCCAERGIERGEGAPWEPLGELPFQPTRGYHAQLGRVGDQRMLSVKGAPEVVIARCARGPQGSLDAEARVRLLRHADGLAADGLRVLAVAERPCGDSEARPDLHEASDLAFVGFVGLRDALRPTSRHAIERLHGAGIRVVMMTGDHPRTAERIAREVGLADGRSVLTGPEIDAKTDDELDEALAEATSIARATPAQKVRIVAALQRRGAVVAMTGDGANDAAAIRLADVGIALGRTATRAAREAADLVVLEPRIDALVDAIAEARSMWAGVRDAVSILAGGNLGEIGFTLLATAFGGGAPFNARQLLVVNLMSDVAPSMALALRPPSREALERHLGEGPERALGAELDRDIRLRAVATAAGAGLAYAGARALGADEEEQAATSLLALVGTQLAQTLVMGRPTKTVVAASAVSATLLLAFVQTPGVNRFFGCKTVGPACLAVAAGSTLAATAGSVVAPRLIAKAAAWAARRRELRLARATG